MKLIRKPQNVDEIVNFFNKLGDSYRIHHGTYSTVIETESGKIKFAGNSWCTCDYT